MKKLIILLIIVWMAGASSCAIQRVTTNVTKSSIENTREKKRVANKAKRQYEKRLKKTWIVKGLK